MNRSRLKSLTYSIVILLLWASIQVRAQRPKRLTLASANEINQALQQAEADLNSFQAHRKYIIAMGIINPSCINPYKVGELC